MITLAIPRETRAGERRVALVPSVLNKFDRAVWRIKMERGAGLSAGFPDVRYDNIEWCDAAGVLADANIIAKVQAPTLDEIQRYPKDAILIGMLSPFHYPEEIKLLASRGITSFALELLPRVSRAQSMDVLSSQASAAGYKAVLIAAELSTRFFPMLTTAAGTIRPSSVLVIGAGVAGLQAIATAKRLGAIVEAYDIRPEAREQIESLGAKMVPLTIDARGEGGYARALTAEEQTQQNAVLAKHVAKAEVIITTAAIPGRAAPRIISKEMVENMQGGSVIVDMAAESGGNCELTQVGKTIDHQGVTIAGPLNLPSSLARDSSEMYSRNVLNFLQLLTPTPQWDDDIVKASLLTHQSEIQHAPTRARLQGVPA